MNNLPKGIKIKRGISRDSRLKSNMVKCQYCNRTFNECNSSSFLLFNILIEAA